MRGGFSAGQAQASGGTSFNTAVAAAGSTLATGTPITQDICIVTGADGTKGVTLPAGQPGDSCFIFNNSGSTLKVYPPNSSSAICVPGTGLGSNGAAFSHLTYKTAEYYCISSTQWLVNVTA